MDREREYNLRYSRHLLLPEVGKEGQAKLSRAKVLVVGAGGLGCPTILYLAAAGIGTIGICEFDSIDLSNLQRQILYTSDEVGAPKLEKAAARAGSLNPLVDLKLHREKISADNVMKIVEQYDVIIDGTDNFTTRYLLNDACVFLHKPYVYGAIYRFEGQVSVFAPSGPCYRCLYPEAPQGEAIPNCAEGGVLGVIAGVIGTLQTTEALKLVLGIGTSLCGRLQLFDALEGRFDFLNVKRDPKCPICGDSPTITTIREESVVCAAEPFKTLNASQLKEKLQTADQPLLLDVRNPEEFDLGHLPAAKLIPLPVLEQHLSELDKNAEIVVYCRSGARSRKAATTMVASGFNNVTNLEGGIMSWAKEIDPSVGY